MTDPEYARRLDEIDRLLNDPAVPMQPARVWSLLDDLRQRARYTQHPSPAEPLDAFATRL